MRKTPMIMASNDLFNVKPSMRKKLERVYQTWRKKGLFPMYSADFEVAWFQMSDEERIALYQVAVKKSRRKKSKVNKTAQHKVNRKMSFGIKKGKGTVSISTEMDSEMPQVEIERNIHIEKPLIIVKVGRNKSGQIPEIDNRMPARLSSTRIAGLLK